MNTRFAVIVTRYEEDKTTDYSVVDSTTGEVMALTTFQNLALDIAMYLENVFRVDAFHGLTKPSLPVGIPDKRAPSAKTWSEYFDSKEGTMDSGGFYIPSEKKSGDNSDIDPSEGNAAPVIRK